MDFLRELGPAALGLRLERLSDRIREQSAWASAALGTELPAGCWPLFMLVWRHGPLAVGACAGQLGLAHPTVVRAAHLLRRRRWLSVRGDRADRRKSLLSLTPAGRAAARRMAGALGDLGAAVDGELRASGSGLLVALERFESQLARPGLARRIVRRSLERRPELLRITDFASGDAAAFRDLNLHWIRRYFAVEAPDRAVLGAPERHVIVRGGCILMARVGGVTVGTCALLRHEGREYELAKMAVDERWRGLGIGEALVRAAVRRFRRLRGRRLYLETNSALEPAVRLYRKAGFVSTGAPLASRYSRADLVMEYRPAASDAPRGRSGRRNTVARA